MNEKPPGEFDKKTIFVTTGAEAVENAVKIARTATGRSAVTAFGGGLHGRTFLGIGLTDKVELCIKGFGAMMPVIYHVFSRITCRAFQPSIPSARRPNSSKPTFIRIGSRQ